MIINQYLTRNRFAWYNGFMVINEAIYQEIMDKTEPVIEAAFMKGGHATQAEADAHVAEVNTILAPYGLDYDGMIGLIDRHITERNFG